MTDELLEFPDDWERALCVVAHPDDIEFGAAGAVASWTSAGKSVAYLLVTRGEAGIDGRDPKATAGVREAEQRRSGEIVGVDAVDFLDHVDGIIEYGLPLRRDIAAVIRRRRPQLVVGMNHRERTFTGKWNSADHRNTGLALLDAVSDAGNRWIFPDLGLEPWGGVTHVALSSSPHATHAVDVSGVIDAAVRSLEAHHAYLHGLGLGTDVRAPLTGLFELTGRRFGGRPAVSFELVF